MRHKSEISVKLSDNVPAKMLPMAQRIAKMKMTLLTCQLLFGQRPPLHDPSPAFRTILEIVPSGTCFSPCYLDLRRRIFEDQRRGSAGHRRTLSLACPSLDDQGHRDPIPGGSKAAGVEREIHSTLCSGHECRLLDGVVVNTRSCRCEQHQQLEKQLTF